MKRYINRDAQERIKNLPQEYQELYEDIKQHIDTNFFDSKETNYHLMKLLKDIEKHIEKDGTYDEFIQFNKDKFRIKKLEDFKVDHKHYKQRNKTANKITNICLVTLITYSLFILALNAYYTNHLSNVWIALILFVISLVLIVFKISICKKIRLARIYVYSDIIIYILITVICMMTTYYFMLFLWVYYICYLFYLQKRIVERAI